MVSRRLREFTDEDIAKVAEVFDVFRKGELEDEKGFCAAVDIEGIAKQDYILTPGRYVGIAETEDDGEPFDEKVARITGELSTLFSRSHELEEEIKKQLGSIGIEL
jgi:type I restriction enzyme M protein